MELDIHLVQFIIVMVILIAIASVFLDSMVILLVIVIVSLSVIMLYLVTYVLCHSETNKSEATEV